MSNRLKNVALKWHHFVFLAPRGNDLATRNASSHERGTASNYPEGAGDDGRCNAEPEAFDIGYGFSETLSGDSASKSLVRFMCGL